MAIRTVEVALPGSPRLSWTPAALLGAPGLSWALLGSPGPEMQVHPAATGRYSHATTYRRATFAQAFFFLWYCARWHVRLVFCAAVLKGQAARERSSLCGACVLAGRIACIWIFLNVTRIVSAPTSEEINAHIISFTETRLSFYCVWDGP